jgi:hypothetical protein
MGCCGASISTRRGGVRCELHAGLPCLLFSPAQAKFVELWALSCAASALRSRMSWVSSNSISLVEFVTLAPYTPDGLRLERQSPRSARCRAFRCTRRQRCTKEADTGQRRGPGHAVRDTGGRCAHSRAWLQSTMLCTYPQESTTGSHGIRVLRNAICTSSKPNSGGS